MTPHDRWRDQLAGWAIPDEIMAGAPTDPWALSVQQFADRADEARRRPLTPSHRRAAERLPYGGSVLDVGCGGGAGSLPLADRADLLIGADPNPQMLEAFADAVAGTDAESRAFEGRWPDIADDVPAADVVVCQHVIYNVPELAAFASALSDHARYRVVVELPINHPLAWLRPYWHSVHGLERPDGPTADTALEIFAEVAGDVHSERWCQPSSLHAQPLDAQVAFIGQRLCVGDDRQGQIADLVRALGVPPERRLVTAWWDIDT